jgi:hypothetical protein
VGPIWSYWSNQWMLAIIRSIGQAVNRGVS